MAGLTCEIAALAAADVEPDTEPADVPPPTVREMFGRCSPHLLPPEWLAEFVDVLDAALRGEAIRRVFAAPPQHGKTECVKHALVGALHVHGSKSAYVSYSGPRAEHVGRQVKVLARLAGLTIDGTKGLLRCVETGAEILFAGALGGITGHTVNLLFVVDDALKNAAEAASPTIKGRILDGFRQDAFTRGHRTTSYIVMMTRWAEDDLSGSMIEAGWPYTNIRAISNGEALAPSLHTLAALQEKRRILGAYGFGAMYLGEPRPPEGTIFRGAKCYTERPFGRPAIGCDLAYTAKTSADWSVAVELLKTTLTDNGLPVYAVMRVRRSQCEAPDFVDELRAASEAWGGARIRWRASGTESGSAQFFQRAGLPISVTRPPGDKLTSAMAAAAAWNDGRILVPDVAHFPECEQWLTPFLKCIHGFTGSNREQDDDVDALGAAMSLLDTGPARLGELREKIGGLPLRMC